jgi:putative SOS response-associated peptidase YedK
MCGRYTLTRHDDAVEDLQASLGVAAQPEEAATWWKPRFNVAPTQPAPVVILRDGVRTLELMRWGLVPFWATRDGKKPPLMITARAESLGAKAWFRDALDHRRCLVPADGFFEWKQDGKRSLPVYFHPADRRIFAFAGLWAKAKTAAGEQLSFTIITGKPNELVAPIHNRMPIVLDASTYAAWLDPSLDGEGARALLGVPPVGGWTSEPVSTWVNKADHDDPTCIAPLAEEPPPQRSLF